MSKLKILLQSSLGLLLGAFVTEATMSFRDNGAFPHLNVYIPDAKLGVRLAPLEETRVQLQQNPSTDVRINAQGYRGGAWPPPSPGEVLIVGDSQVFGLGVEEADAFSAQLASLTGQTVINAGVPTYGPQEYTAVAAEIIEARHPEVVIYTINMVNDLFERERPNHERHHVWDGWAVRSETAPTSQMDFPGRSWLYQRSHAFFALRRLLYAQQSISEGPQVSYPSEGDWSDIVGQSQYFQDLQSAELAEHAQQLTAFEAATQNEVEQLRHVDEALKEILSDELGEQSDRTLVLEAARGQPGDIVGYSYYEASRDIAVTATLMRRGTRYRQALIDKVRREYISKSEVLEAALLAQDSQTAQTAQLLRELLQSTDIPSPLFEELSQMKQICDAAGVKLAVLVLPMDVQVSSREWLKYQHEELDMRESLYLNREIQGDAQRLGSYGIDPLSALQAAGPGVFLDGDIHLSASGHRVVAEVIVEALKQPPPVRLPMAGLPSERTWVPASQAWNRTPEIRVKNSSAAKCETIQIAEWLRISCLREGGMKPSDVVLKSGGGGEAMIMRSPDSVSMVVPLTAGEALEADFLWQDHQRRLSVEWHQNPEGEWVPDIAFSAPKSGGRELNVSEAEQHVCDCYQTVSEEQSCELHGPAVSLREPYHEYSWLSDCQDSCAQLFGGQAELCVAQYGDDCEAVMDCVHGRPQALPHCPEGRINAGGNGTCLVLCDAAHPCEDGDCHPWMGAGLCW